MRKLSFKVDHVVPNRQKLWPEPRAMNLVTISKSLLQKTKCFSVRKSQEAMATNTRSGRVLRSIHQKSGPPLASETEVKDLDEVKSTGSDESLPRVEKIQRDIFGATILPQNLSFENTKKLSENQIKLEDIPLVDENEAAEDLFNEKLKTIRTKPSSKTQRQQQQQESREETAVVGVDDMTKRQEVMRRSHAELFWVADPYEEIPGPRILRSLVKALENLTRQLTIVSLFRLVKANSLASFRAYGPIVKLPEILGGKILLISRPEHISSVLEQDERYPINSTLDSIQRSRLLRYRLNPPLGYHLSDEDWDNIKKSLAGCQLKGFEGYFDGIDDVTGKFVRRIRGIRNRQNEVPDDFLFEINKWSLECLCLLIFDRTFGFLDNESSSWPSKTSQLLYSLTVATRNLCHLETGFQFWRFMNTSSLSSLGSACEVLENIISEYLAQVQLSLARKTQETNPGGIGLIESWILQDSLSPDDVVTNILDTLIIGMNTMSTALGFLFYHLSQNLRAQSLLWKEVKEVLPEKYDRLEYAQLRSLRYLQACLKESLRLKMPMPVFTRILSQNVTLNNYQVPRGTFILMTPQVEGMKEENFDNPFEFIPERWLDRDDDHPLTSLPMGNYFHDGFVRRIAEVGIWMCACHVVRNFVIEYHYDDIEATCTAISFPNKPLKFTFVDRIS